jgi:outer membrane protein assembly factor BamB
MKKLSRSTLALATTVNVFAVGLLLADDWPQWGGTQSKNMVSNEKNLPVKFEAGKRIKGTEDIDMSTTLNCKFVLKLGSQTYGTPTIGGGRILIGTNNETPRDDRHIGDRGIVMSFDEKTGAFQWQLVVPKLGAGKVSDWEFLGTCSSATIDGDRAYIVTNRCQIACIDLNGMANGNQGFADEAKFMADTGKPPIEPMANDADILWTYDMIGELGVFPHNIASSSILVVGDKLFATTSNGVDWTHLNRPAPNAPSMICLDKKTGALLGEESAGVSDRVLHCSWSSPGYAEIAGVPQVIFGGGDGWCYGFGLDTKKNENDFDILNEYWRYDCNPKEYRVGKDGVEIKYAEPEGPSEVVGTAVTYKGKIYVCIGQDPEHGPGVGMLSCIDPSKRGDLSGKAVWTFKGMERSMSTPSIVDDLIYVCDYAGRVYCVDATTGKEYWQFDTKGHIWGSTLVADDKVYVANEEGEVYILAAGKELKVLDGYDLRLMSSVETKVPDGYGLQFTSVDELDEIPQQGQKLIVVAMVGLEKKEMHVRIFDESENIVIDKPESKLLQNEGLEELKKLGSSAFPHGSALSLDRKRELTQLVSSVAGPVLPVQGRSLVVVALARPESPNVHVRIFSASGSIVIDKSPDKLRQGKPLDELAKLAKSAQHRAALPLKQSREIIDLAIEVSRHTPSVEFPAPIYASPVAANGVLYIATQSHLFAFAKPTKEKAK